MIATQYGFTLPVDYDMNIIERRIREKGHLLNGFPDLRFKAYLSAERRKGSAENLYAPFYLWDDPAGVDNFITGPGFAALTRDFGWPVVKTFVVWHAALGQDLSEARVACREWIRSGRTAICRLCVRRKSRLHNGRLKPATPSPL